MNDRERQIFAVIQLCREAGHNGTAHILERESGLYFDMEYFSEVVLSGNWGEAEKYLSGFTNPRQNRYSIKTYFEIRKIAFLEALQCKDRTKALDILVKDMKFIQNDNKTLYDDMTKLLTLDDIRENSTLTPYPEDNKPVREALVVELEKLIEANPVFDGKLTFRGMDRQKMNHLRNLCLGLNRNSLIGSDTNNSPSQATFSFPVVTDSATKLPINPNEVMASPTNQYTPVPYKYRDVPRNVILMLEMDSRPTSMDFHPSKSSLLLVGTSGGDVALWDLDDKKLLHQLHFTVWDINSCSKDSQIALEIDATALRLSNSLEMSPPRISVTRIVWSPNGYYFGVAFSIHMVQLYSFHDGKQIQRKFEIDAHKGRVNDVAFSSHSGELLVMTCGDDKKIKVWDMITGNKKFTFEGHDAPVYSLYPHVKQNVHFFFSVSVDGNIKAWFYDGSEAKLDFPAPRLGRTKLAYSADGLRLFSCGTNSNGESVLAEWNDDEGYIKRRYQGLNPRQPYVVQLGLIKNLLAVGDDGVIKFWDMDDEKLLGIVDAKELMVTPQICFNKAGTLLAVDAQENRIKILATDQGRRLLSPWQHTN